MYNLKRREQRSLCRPSVPNGDGRPWLRAPKKRSPTDTSLSFNALLASPSQDHIDTGENRRKSRPRDFPNTLLEDLSVKRDDLGNVGNGRFGEAGIARGEQDVARGLAPLELRREGHTDNSSERAAVQSVALHDEDRATKPWARTDRITQSSPPNLTLTDHHSELWRTLRAAR